MTNDHPMDDDFQLLDRCIAGDREAFDELVLKHQKPLFSLLYRMVSDADDAADILQKTFVKAFTGIQGFERRSSFRTWLYQIAINLAKNLYRDRSRAAKVSLDDVIIRRDPKTLESLIRKETRDRLYKALTALPEKQRLTVMLRVQEQKTFDEIAGIMQCSVGTSKANYHHGVQKLKAMFEDHRIRGKKQGEGNDVQK
jgi:RNA polymerase sigma-70 factor, ECF subfamily